MQGICLSATFTGVCTSTLPGGGEEDGSLNTPPRETVADRSERSTGGVVTRVEVAPCG